MQSGTQKPEYHRDVALLDFLGAGAHSIGTFTSTRRAVPTSIIGMMADEPDVMDEACKLALAARAKSRMRPTDA
jgi:hypothetical protein